MTDFGLYETILKEPNKTAVLTKLKYNKAMVEILFDNSCNVKYRFKFMSVRGARTFIEIVRIKSYKEIDKSKY